MAFRKTRMRKGSRPFRRVQLDTREMLICASPLHIDLEATACNTAAAEMVEVDLVAASSTFGTSQGMFHTPFFIETTHFAPPADVSFIESRTFNLVHLFEALIVVPFELGLGKDQSSTRTPAFVPLPWSDAGISAGTGREHYNVIWQKMHTLFHWQESLETAHPGFENQPTPEGMIARAFARPKRRVLLGERESLYYVRSAWVIPWGNLDSHVAEFDVISNVRYRYGIRPKFL